MRAALAPTSLPPTRDTERTSMRLPAPSASTRITTSSLKPNHNVVSVASMRPLVRLGRDDLPTHLAGCCQRTLERFGRCGIHALGAQVGITL